MYFLVGEVSSVVYYKNENDTFQGCITIEFIRVESVQLAIDKMNNFDMNGNELVVEEVYCLLIPILNHIKLYYLYLI